MNATQEELMLVMRRHSGSPTCAGFYSTSIRLVVKRAEGASDSSRQKKIAMLQLLRYQKVPRRYIRKASRHSIGIRPDLGRVFVP